MRNEECPLLESWPFITCPNLVAPTKVPSRAQHVQYATVHRDDLSVDVHVLREEQLH